MGLSVLVIDDDAEERRRVAAALREHGHRVELHDTASEAWPSLDRADLELVIAAASPAVDPFLVLARARQRPRPPDVIVVDDVPTLPRARRALRGEACDYLSRPIDGALLAEAVARAAERHPGSASASGSDLDELALWGRSPPMTRLLNALHAVAASDASVLITGESGTGKELVAHAVHAYSRRASGPFVALSCAAFPETLIEEELFGHEKGAFTGALRRREGRFRAAHGGTLFLDEVAELSAHAQAKLLRVLQTLEYEPIGSNTPVRVDVRVVSATNRDLRAMIGEGRFREDLYYRLKVFGLHVPPLRERSDDLPGLIGHFLRRLAPSGKPAPALTPAASELLRRHSYPGNVRELAHAIEHAVVLARGGPIGPEHLPLEIAGDPPASLEPPRPLAEAVREFEREYLDRVLRHTGGIKSRAARLLGISRKTLWEKLREHGLSRGGGEDDETPT